MLRVPVGGALAMAEKAPDSDPPYKLFLGGAMAICFLGILQLTSVTLDVPLTIALYAFVAAAPFLATCLVFHHDLACRPGWGHRWGAIMLASSTVAVVGLGGIVWHQSVIAAFLLAGAIAVALVLYQTTAPADKSNVIPVDEKTPTNPLQISTPSEPPN